MEGVDAGQKPGLPMVWGIRLSIITADALCVWFVHFLHLATVTDSPVCRMLLVRHGETNYNADGRIQGRLEGKPAEPLSIKRYFHT